MLRTLSRSERSVSAFQPLPERTSPRDTDGDETVAHTWRIEDHRGCASNAPCHSFVLLSSVIRRSDISQAESAITACFQHSRRGDQIAYCLCRYEAHRAREAQCRCAV